MIPAAFDYEVAESVDHAIELLESDEDAKLLAGGHSLVPAMKLRLARPSLLVDVGRLSKLSYVTDVGTQLAIGALTRHKDVRDNPLIQESCPIVSTRIATDCEWLPVYVSRASTTRMRLSVARRRASYSTLSASSRDHDSPTTAGSNANSWFFPCRFDQ